ncbi:hypothetical protein MAR_004304 [Mya arenaria]|uniref:Uncharacterized protein n=2 Tax=Mya arenaria TaxID=6604 RepID=A0ABY7EYZ6_MYAAR|nr:hypothetical protein MAR_004304 [Mya arenaria]
MEEDSAGIKTGSLVALIVSFVLVFVAGLVIGLFFCRRRRNKYEESMVVGFNNVLYEPALTSPLHGSRVKDTNIILATHRNDDLDTDTESEHRYVDIADLGNGPCGLSNVKGAKFVDLPTCQDIDKEAESFTVNCVNQNIYDTVKDSWSEKDGDEEEPSAESRSRSNDEPEGGVIGAEQDDEEFSEFEGAAAEMTGVPPPVPCRHFGGTPFSPEFLKKDTDVSQAYSNNLYGYHK